ncbi:MAG: EpsG family protein [Bacteroidales bacterium]|nr:EpsG family protein [Bacteroidales bacterium]
MVPYIIFLLCIILCYWRTSPKAMLFVFILFAVLRYDTGWDYHSYEIWVMHPKEWCNAETSRYSWFWRELFRLSYQLKFPHLSIVLPNALTYILIYFALDILKLSKQQKVEALFVYATIFSFYLGSFSIIRQAFAMSCGFIAFAFLNNKKYYLAAIAYLIAVHLHTSACVLILIVPVYYLRNKLRVTQIIIAIGLVSIMLLFASNILNLLESVDMTRYELYLKMQDNYGGKLIYVNVLLSIYLFLSFYRSKNISPLIRQCYFLAIVSLIGSNIRYFMGLLGVLDRVFDYFTLFLTIVLLTSVNAWKNHRIIKPLAIIILSAYFLVYLIVSSPGEQVASSGFVPYKCILTEKTF